MIDALMPHPIRVRNETRRRWGLSLLPLRGELEPFWSFKDLHWTLVILSSRLLPEGLWPVCTLLFTWIDTACFGELFGEPYPEGDLERIRLIDWRPWQNHPHASEAAKLIKPYFSNRVALEGNTNHPQCLHQRISSLLMLILLLLISHVSLNHAN